MLWGLRPVEHQATYDATVDLLRRQVHSGLLLPGEKLPAERRLSEDLGVSRVTLREALRVLEASGYITTRRGAHGGAFVTSAEALADIARRRISRAPAEAMRVLEFLCIAEHGAVRYAIDRCGVPETKRMEYAITLMQDAPSPSHLKQAETYFHLALGDATHNRMLARGIDDALCSLFLPPEERAFETAKEASVGEHIGCFDALQATEAPLATAHLARVHDAYWARVRAITGPNS
ncbi:MAG: GntR family transcriptional regulator [Pseudomonadota bacterium]